jgi:hypothetical protein
VVSYSTYVSFVTSCMDRHARLVLPLTPDAITHGWHCRSRLTLSRTPDARVAHPTHAGPLRLEFKKCSLTHRWAVGTWFILFRVEPPAVDELRVKRVILSRTLCLALIPTPVSEGTYQ